MRIKITYFSIESYWMSLSTSQHCCNRYRLTHINNIYVSFVSPFDFFLCLSSFRFLDWSGQYNCASRFIYFWIPTEERRRSNTFQCLKAKFYVTFHYVSRTQIWKRITHVKRYLTVCARRCLTINVIWVKSKMGAKRKLHANKVRRNPKTKSFVEFWILSYFYFFRREWVTLQNAPIIIFAFKKFVWKIIWNWNAAKKSREIFLSIKRQMAAVDLKKLDGRCLMIRSRTIDELMFTEIIS